MGRQNFAAGLEMTIGSVVRNYLRWFELNKYKKELKSSEDKGSWRRSLFSRRVESVPVGIPAKVHEGADAHAREAAGANPQSIDFIDPLA
jgi:hypothetical protein